MNKFTKDYIREADCEEIQGLRQILKYGDWILLDNEKILINKSKGGHCYVEDENYYSFNPINKRYIWLPTGDQLTEEILKRCYTYNLNLECFSEHHCKKPNCQKWGISIEADNHVVNHEFNREVWNKDILIAKIKLLKQLLK